MKTPLSLPLLLSAVLFASLAGCTTLANRRDMFSPQEVEGPYTRMLKNGIPKPSPTPAPAPKNDGKKVL